ncbi:MAG: hypothetical protein WBG17_08960 [Burkholderiaceae bacterium]
MDDACIYQRTDSGRQEIHNKTHGLTQSERVALLMIDGATSYQALSRKLLGLTPQRLERALLKLAQLGLATEILLPESEPNKDAFAPEVVDSFLRQDPLDPVTLIRMDGDMADEDLLVTPPPAPSLQPEVFDMNSWAVTRTSDTVRAPRPASSSEAKQGRSPKAHHADIHPKKESRARMTPAPVTPRQARWEFWLIGLGLALIAVSMLRGYLH